ncbi:MAG: replication protein, partial [bacterium]|nr:replication protein [bacterium]
MHLRREILIRDFNKRERIVLELIHQLTVDMKRESVELLPSEFTVVGIDKSKIQSVLTELVKNQVLLIQEHQFRINQTVADWQVPVGEGYNKKKFYQLVYGRDNPSLFRAQQAAPLPEHLTNDQPSCQNSNIQEELSCQKSNTTGCQNGNS